MNDELRGRWVWKAMPWGLFTVCDVCGEISYCHGKTREWMVCLECFAGDRDVAKLRRGGQKGIRSGYTYRSRRPKSGMVGMVAAMRSEGMVIGAIAETLGISEKTVKNYLSIHRTAENCAATPLPERGSVPRKEHPGSRHVGVSGDR